MHWANGAMAIADDLKRTDAVATGLHEFGHSVELNKFNDLPDADRNAVIDAWRRDRAKNTTIEQARPITAQKYPDQSRMRPAGAYEKSFREWFAEQVSRWITKNESPTGVVEKFFHGIAQVGRAL
jgi:hypothetical protein